MLLFCLLVYSIYVVVYTIQDRKAVFFAGTYFGGSKRLLCYLFPIVFILSFFYIISVQKNNINL